MPPSEEAITGHYTIPDNYFPGSKFPFMVKVVEKVVGQNYRGSWMKCITGTRFSWVLDWGTLWRQC